MAFTTSTEIFQSIFMTGGEDAKLAETFFKSAMRYLSKRRNVEEAALLYDWIRQGNPVHGFLCRQDVVSVMADDLIMEHVPFLCVKEPRGDTGFLIRSIDVEHVEPVKKNVLDKKARFCKIVTGEELKMDILKNGGSDKSILYVSGLSEEEVEILRGLSEENLDEDALGIDTMEDGTFTVSFLGASLFKKKRGNTLSQVLALLMLQSLGMNADINQRIARNSRNFNVALAKNFQKKGVNLKRTPAWIVGNGKNYMRMDGYGFEYGVAVAASDGHVDMEEQYNIDANSPDYQLQLLSYLSRIENKTVTYDAGQAVRHLSGKDAGLQYARTGDSRIIHMFEKELIAKVDEVVMNRIQNDPVMRMDGRWDQKLNFYMSEVAKVLDGVRMDQLPEKYSRNQFEEIKAIGDSHGLKLGAYEPAIKRMRHLETTLVLAELPRIKSISKKIEGVGSHERRDYSREKGHIPPSRTSPSRSGEIERK